MTAEIISVGTELLLGNIVNTNAQYLAQKCAGLGLSMYYQSVVGDNEERMTESFRQALSRSDILILTGGLGPTEDDMTKEVCAKVMGRTLYLDEHSKSRIEDYFVRTGRKQITENNWKQAMVPEGAIVLDNHNGTAPGLIIEQGEKCAILLPGPPNELIPLFTEQVEPYLRSRCPETIYSEMVKLCGVGESRAETMIKDLIDAQTNPTIATYAKTAECDIRVTARANNETEAEEIIRPVVEELYRRFGHNIFTIREDETLEQVVVNLLKRNCLTVTTAESCTGGLLASRLINVPGASFAVKSAFVTYCDEEKMRLLGVPKEFLDKYTAVSAEVAEAMAVGGAKAGGANACLSVTGIAGPDGGTKERPVGLVYIGCYLNGKTVVREYRLRGNREKIREQAVVQALDLLRRCLIEQEGE
ncbi:MAG: competence/damage-inducible protein A [Lachnospiraceae bacterium]|nr:competence/damage-inducible protein A [Lachnospiraceae bacterium]